MNYLLEILGRVGIFIVLVQTLLHFKTNDGYEKYIRMLTNIMILSMLIIPVIGIFNKNIPQEMNQQIAYYQQQLQEIEDENVMEQKIEEEELTQKQVLQAYEEEIKTKINNETTQNNYEVKKVVINGIKKDGTYNEEEFQIQITVCEKKEDTLQKIEVEKIQINGGENLDHDLKRTYAELLGIDEIYLEVEISG